MHDNQSKIINILHMDSAVQSLLRINWPESWLRINLPIGSTRALLAIEGFNAHTPGRVAEVLGLSRTTVTGLLDRLEDAGLVTRAIDPGDRRSFSLQVTPQGRALLHEIESFRQEQLECALQTMDDASLAALSTGLHALTAAIRGIVVAPASQEKEHSTPMSTTVLRNQRPIGPHYKWIALSNTTLGVLMAAINNSILLISLPDIFRGLGVNPLEPSESNYLLWMLLGYMVVTATLLVTFGRLSDIFGRVRLYNAGFVVFTFASLLLFMTPSSGNTGALEIILFRLLQGVGGGLLLANSAAILTDAFPINERGMALGLNMVATLAGSLFGLLIGGLLAAWWWRAVFLVSVPIGIAGTIWAYLMLREQSQRQGSQSIDLLGNICFGGGLTIFLVAMTYGISPYGNSNTGWGNPLVIGGLIIGLALLGLFIWVEQRVPNPLFNLDLFKIRSFAAGCAAQLLSSLAYGGLQFVLIVWLQGIWLPLHGYTFESTPFWSAVYMLPLLIGFMIFGAAGGWLSDRVDPRTLCTAAMLVLTLGFAALAFFPIDFAYAPFAVVLFVIGAAFGGFSAPNSAAIMNALPRAERGVGSGIRTTFTNAGNPLSLAIFFSIIVVVLSSSLPFAIQSGLTQNGVTATVATEVAHVPPTGALFAAFLGYNPMSTLLPPAALQALPATSQATILSTNFFPTLIGGPLISALHVIFWFSAVLALLAAGCSYLRGKRFVYEELGEDLVEAQSLQPVPSA